MMTLYTRHLDPARASTAHALHHHKGTVIYFEGDPARHWYEVLGGVVRTCRFHADGHRQLTGFFYSGDVFGVEDGFYQEAAEAVTAVTLRRHEHEQAPSVDGGDEAMGQSETALRRALASAQQCIFLLGHRTAAERLAAFLLTIARRLGAAEGVPVPMSRADIADHLGLTIHTVSRTMSELARQKLIGLEGPQLFRILNAAALRELAGDAEPERLTRDDPEIAMRPYDRLLFNSV